LVLLHGLGETSIAWRPVYDALSRDYDVIAVDLPGFGSSSPLPSGTLPTAAALADAVEREMDAIGVTDVHVAGNSLGARIAFELAGRGRVRSMIAISPDGLGTPVERVYQVIALVIGRLAATLLAPIATPLTSTGPGRSLFFIGERSRPWRLTADDSRDLLLNFARSPGYLPTAAASVVDLPISLDKITCPVLILQGTLDPLVSMQSPRYLAFVPQAQWRWLAGLNHVAISDDPATVSRLMLDFLDSQNDHAGG